MAIFVFAAWVCEAAYNLGLLPEARDTQSLAYRQANYCLHEIRQRVVGQRLTAVEDHRVAWEGGELRFERPSLFYDGEGGRVELSDLGMPGWVLFSRSNPDTLSVRVRATHVEGGQYDLAATLALSAAPG